MKSKAEVKQQVIQKNDVLIYCGPNLSSGILQRFAVFKGDLPKHINEHIKKCPAIKELFVIPKSLAEFRKNIEIEGSRQNVLFNQVLEYERSDK